MRFALLAGFAEFGDYTGLCLNLSKTMAVVQRFGPWQWPFTLLLWWSVSVLLFVLPLGLVIGS